jgi:hypothetical protein
VFGPEKYKRAIHGFVGKENLRGRTRDTADEHKVVEHFQTGHVEPRCFAL